MTFDKMERPPARWAGMDPVAVADGSKSQMRWAIVDAKHDIALLVAEVERLRAGPLNIGDALATLLNLCQRNGKVVTIELEPLKPLAMGNYRYVVNLRDVRERAK